MSTSPVSPEDIRAAAEVHNELGPEYSDAVVAAFLDKVDRAVAARVEARLAEAPRAEVQSRAGRRTLVKGVAIGVCAGAVITAAGVSSIGSTAPVVRAHPISQLPHPKPPPAPPAPGN
jgi:hypothetical protein